MYTDQTIEKRISEVIREKIFQTFREEVPYATFVEINDLDDTGRVFRISATVFVERDSQKAMIIGKGGEGITMIGSLARTDLEAIFGKKIFLLLRVKTMPKWKKNKKLLKRITS